MQQAYRALRVISEAQTIRIVLTNQPGALLLEELQKASEALQDKSSAGIKAVILTFNDQASGESEKAEPGEELQRARAAVRAIPQPVLAVACSRLSTTACALLLEADFTLVAHEALLQLPDILPGEDNSLGGLAAARLGYATWSVPAAELDQERERVLTLLRSKSAVALRNAKASTRLASPASPQLESLRQISQFYLETVLSTRDAREGLRATQTRRQAHEQNR